MEQWEDVALWTLRLKVWGGWLVRVSRYQGDESVTFIEDPEHRWKIGEWALTSREKQKEKI
jgi:hypothetical protein